MGCTLPVGLTMWKPTPEFTWTLIQLNWWACIGYTIFVNYACDNLDATISAVMARKGNENYWIPAIALGLIAHWWWPVR